MGTGTDVAMKSAQVPPVKGDLIGIVPARNLSRASIATIDQKLAFFLYDTPGAPPADGVLCPWIGLQAHGDAVDRVSADRRP
jgi:cation transport ATPase